MLYLAEIQKQNKTFMGGVESKLKLIACQRNDRSWSVVNNEFMTTDRAGDFGEGALLTLELGVNRQIQKLELASPEILQVLKNFSRLLQKTQEQEQEIAQWKASLEQQSEEISRRQLEMEARLEQVEQMEEEFNEFEQQRAEIAAAQAATEQVRAEFEAKSAELQGAWEQLKGQQQSLEERIKEGNVLDSTQAEKIKEQLSVLEQVTASRTSLQERVAVTVTTLSKQQELLQPKEQNLNDNQQAIKIKQEELATTTAQLSEQKQQVESLSKAIAQTEQQLKVEQKSLEAKQELSQLLQTQAAEQESLLEMLSGSQADGGTGSKINIQELENIPLPNLESIVEELKKDLEKVARFVNDQEEELGWQCKAVEELEAKIQNANEFERLTLEQELADELEAKKMLDQTLVGQRRSLKERHQYLLQHSRVLKRRQGVIDFDFESELPDIDLEPIIKGLNEQHQSLNQKQSELGEEIAQIEQNIQDLTASLEQQKNQKSELETTISHQQSVCNDINLNVVKLQSEIDFYQQQLQPLQTTLTAIEEQIQAIEQLMATGDGANPHEAVQEIARIINELTAK